MTSRDASKEVAPTRRCNRWAPWLARNGHEAFERLFQRIDAAKESIVIRCFDWRDDTTGIAVGERLMAAADRGVEITIYKDRVGAMYEYFEGSRQSFFHKDEPLLTHLQALVLKAVYTQLSSTRQKDNPLARALVEHPRITVHRNRKLYDHSKVYIFDDECIYFGGMGIGDDFRERNIDYMVEIDDPAVVRHFHRRRRGELPFNPNRRIDFMLHVQAVQGRQDCPLLTDRLELIASAKQRLAIEMAYLGDSRFTQAMVDATKRGVDVTLTAAKRANVLADLNRSTCATLLRQTRGGPGRLRIALHERMVHSKVIVVDGHTALVGSTNFTPISYGIYDEVDLYLRDEAFAGKLEASLDENFAEATLCARDVPYRRIFAVVERAIVAYQSREASADGVARKPEEAPAPQAMQHEPSL